MLTIIGCGNITRCDDGLGPHVARVLRSYVATLHRRDVTVYDAGTDGMSVMFAARGSDALIIVDAANMGVEPGAVYEVPGDVLARDYTASLNLHDFRWDHALAAGQRIYRTEFPATVHVILVGVQSIAYGLELSEPVRTAADVVIERIKGMIAEYGAQTEPVAATPAAARAHA